LRGTFFVPEEGLSEEPASFGISFVVRSRCIARGGGGGHTLALVGVLGGLALALALILGVRHVQ
jgi:hypothetical protein